jgi:hypothetical protein
MAYGKTDKRMRGSISVYPLTPPEDFITLAGIQTSQVSETCEVWGPLRFRAGRRIVVEVVLRV